MKGGAKKQQSRVQCKVYNSKEWIDIIRRATCQTLMLEYRWPASIQLDCVLHHQVNHKVRLMLQGLILIQAWPKGYLEIDNHTNVTFWAESYCNVFTWLHRFCSNLESTFELKGPSFITEWSHRAQYQCQCRSLCTNVGFLQHKNGAISHCLENFEVFGSCAVHSYPSPHYHCPNHTFLKIPEPIEHNHPFLPFAF